MARELRYEFSASAEPPEPTKTSQLYTGQIPYPVGGGYYAVKAWEDGNTSGVVRKSFEREVVADYIAYYKFDGNTNDETGNYPLTNVGATLTSGVKGVSNTAYNFDGVNDYMYYDEFGFLLQTPVPKTHSHAKYKIKLKYLLAK
jgi:hypothetical protein